MKYKFLESQLTTFNCHLHCPVKCPSERNGREDNLNQNSQTFLIFKHLMNEACLNDTLPRLYPVQFSRLVCNYIPFSSWLKKQVIERNIIIVILLNPLWFILKSNLLSIFRILGTNTLVTGLASDVSSSKTKVSSFSPPPSSPPLLLLQIQWRLIENVLCKRL